MPVYTYRCLDGHEFKARHSMEKTVFYCDVCGKPVKRVIKFFPKVHYKGTGFSVTDDPDAKNPGSK